MKALRVAPIYRCIARVLIDSAIIARELRDSLRFSADHSTGTIAIFVAASRKVIGVTAPLFALLLHNRRQVAYVALSVAAAWVDALGVYHRE